MPRRHEDLRIFGVPIFKLVVLETYWEFSNGIGTIWKLCACSFRFCKRFDLLWSLNYLFFTKCVWLYSGKSKCLNIWRTLLSKISWCWYLSSKIWYRIIENYQNTKNRYFSMCLVDVLTKYGDDRSSFEILSPDNGIPLKNLGLTPLTTELATLSLDLDQHNLKQHPWSGGQW